MQDLTLSANSEDGQKHAVSLLESHFGIESHVFMHMGTRSGHGAGTTDEVGSAGVEMIALVVIWLAPVTAGDGHTVVDTL